jgi:hypothetical protein
MPRRTFPTYVLLMALSLCLSAQSTRAQNGILVSLPLTVSLYNDAGVPASELIQAEHAASWILHDAGLEVLWIHCGGSSQPSPAGIPCREAIAPRHLQLRILSRSRGLPQSTLGISYLTADGRGCYSDLFLEPIRQLRREENYQLNLGTILGNVAAHEVGHLLLGTNSHSLSGIMRPNWHQPELASAARRKLLFTEEQGRSMRRRLAVDTAHRNAGSISSAPSGF